MSHKYKLKYDVTKEHGEFTKEQLGKAGGTDAIIMHSLIYPEDGSFSHNFWSFDGRTGKNLPSIDEFKAWTMMGFALKDRDDLHEWQKEILNDVFNAVREVIMKGRE